MTVVDASAVRDRIEAVLHLAAPRPLGFWAACLGSVEVHRDWAGSNWAVGTLAPEEDARLIGLAANLVRAACPRVG